MIVAVTGGSGFIGGAVARRHLDRGDEVRVLTRRPDALPHGCRGFFGDLTRSDAPLAAFARGADVLYHCAGEVRAVERMVALHVGGTQRLVSAAAGHIGRWVQLSSVGAYGRRIAGWVDEDAEERPLGPYECSKTASDALVRQAALEGAFDWVVLRPATVFGEGMPNRSLAQWIEMVRRGWFFFIGPPGSLVNYIHVDNVVDALLLVAQDPRARGQTFIVSEQRTLEAFVDSIAGTLGVTVPRWRVAETPVRAFARLGRWIPGLPLTESRVDALTARVTYSSRRLAEALGFQVRVPVEEGLARLIAWESRRA